MSAPAPAAAARRSRRGLWLGIAAVLAVVVLSALLSLGDDGRGGPLDPDNPAPEGARAVAKVLDREGVAVDVVRGQDAFLDTDLGPGTSVVVSNADALGASTFARLREHARDAGAIVLVDPGDSVLEAVGVRTRGSQQGVRSAGCDDDLYGDLVVDVPTSTAYEGRGCFAGAGGGAVLVDSPTVDGLEVLGAPAVLANDTVTDGDNAALALRLLGQTDDLVWYVADPADTTADDAVSLGSFLPDWLVPSVWLLAIGFVGVALWRGRRLGPLVSEPMPVVVRAAESTESRGRLYRRTHDRGHAARTLRTATRRRLAAALSLPPPRSDDGSEGAVAALVLAAARATGRTPDEVAALLVDRPVTTDAALADLGRALLQIENEVRNR